MARRLLLIAFAVLLVGSACRPSSEIRPAFTREKAPVEGVVPGRIVFTSQLGGADALFVVEPGERPTRLRFTGQPEKAPAFSPDGSTIAFATSGDDPGIWTGSIDGADSSPVVTGPGFYDNPTWSSEGDRIAYAYSDGPSTTWDIYIAGVDGTEPERVVSSDGQDWHPTWSPDGRNLAFVSDRDGDNAIWLLDVESGDERKIVDSPERDEQPTWSSDGERLLFVSDRDLDRWQMFAYDLESDADDVFFRTDAMDRHPTWSPDGRYVATSIGYLAIYRSDGETFQNGAERWKLSDRLALGSTWGASS